MSCKICGNSEQNITHVAREMMLGLRDEFEYLECSKCGCLQLTEIPGDMGKYYPEDYYSYASPYSVSSILKRLRASYARNGANPLGALVARFYGPDSAIESVLRLNLEKDARVLDVGCGSGGLLLSLSQMGFRNLTGVDPFIDSNTKIGNITLLKKDVSDLKDQFDVVMLHHAFEHMDHPAGVLQQLRQILHPNGTIILRIPLSDSYAWEHYGVNWHQLDAPRHFFLHTRKSLAALAEAAGLSITETVYDSNVLQFIISEEYVRDIPQSDKRSYTKNPFRSIFSLSDIRSFQRQTLQLNQDQRGDSACFYLRKIDSQHS